MNAKDGSFFRCPGCGRKLLRIAPDTKADRLPVYCRSCRREILIDIHRGQSFESRSPGQSDD
jgi:predicted RNA-binding Zn-ribbon protein involved in translation (DUF1610 family)